MINNWTKLTEIKIILSESDNGWIVEIVKDEWLKKRMIFKSFGEIWPWLQLLPDNLFKPEDKS